MTTKRCPGCPWRCAAGSSASRRTCRRAASPAPAATASLARPSGGTRPSMTRIWRRRSRAPRSTARSGRSRARCAAAGSQTRDCCAAACMLAIAWRVLACARSLAHGTTVGMASASANIGVAALADLDNICRRRVRARQRQHRGSGTRRILVLPKRRTCRTKSGSASARCATAAAWTDA